MKAVWDFVQSWVLQPSTRQYCATTNIRTEAISGRATRSGAWDAPPPHRTSYRHWAPVLVMMQALPAEASTPVVAPPVGPAIPSVMSDAVVPQASEPTASTALRTALPRAAVGASSPESAAAATTAMRALSLGADANSTSTLYVHTSLSCTTAGVALVTEHIVPLSSHRSRRRGIANQL